MKSTRQVSRNLAARRLLLVDDEPYWPRFFQETLAQLGIKVIYEHDGESALARLEKGGIDLLVVSASLSDRGVFALLQAACGGSSVPVVIASGAPDWRQGREAYEAGAIEYMAKSYDKKKVVDTIQRILTWQRSKAAER